MSTTGTASTKGSRGKSKASKHVSRSSKAGLQFPVGRIARFLKVLELSGDAAKDSKKNRIGPREIELAVRNDEELSKLLERVTIPNAGVTPHIHHFLYPKSNEERDQELGSGSQQL
ncbi:UNVERIFIED_CONTAM: Histone H2AX [Sesamum latifolium]|uniref:Histone H2A n=1 Tax=Sesamum latifolium TaxID=2727402 RepID=A0AAW2XWK5_9LAMI